MNSLLVQVLSVTLAAAGGAADDHPLLKQLIEQGVPMPGRALVKLSPPTMADGLGAEEQQAVIARVAEPRYSAEEFLRETPVAPLALEIRSLPVPGSTVPARGVDFWFVAYGDWATIGSESFLEGLIKTGEGTREGQLSKSGFLSDADLAKRNIRLQNQPGLEQRFFYTTFSMFDRVELSSTRFSVLARKPDSLLMAGLIDPRFIGDAEFPDQWRPITLDDSGQSRLGPPQAYTSAGFYLKVTRLSKPSRAMFIEYHMVFDEPQEWFGGANLLRSKLPLVLQEQIRSFRRKLAKASAGK